MGKLRVKLGVTGEPGIVLSLEGPWPELGQGQEQTYIQAVHDAIMSSKISPEFLSLRAGMGLTYQASPTEARRVDLINIFLMLPATGPEGRPAISPRRIDSIVINLRSLNSVTPMGEGDQLFGGLLRQLDQIESGIIPAAPGGAGALPRIPNPQGIHPGRRPPGIKVIK